MRHGIGQSVGFFSKTRYSLQNKFKVQRYRNTQHFLLSLTVAYTFEVKKNRNILALLP